MRQRFASFTVAIAACASAHAAERAIDKAVIVDASVERMWEARTAKAGADFRSELTREIGSKGYYRKP